MKTGKVIKQFVIFHPFGMDFAKMARGTIYMPQTLKTGEVINQNVNFNPFCTDFAKMALVTIYMLQTLKTGSTFFHKEPNYLLKMFLGPIVMVKVPKNT